MRKLWWWVIIVVGIFLLLFVSLSVYFLFQDYPGIRECGSGSADQCSRSCEVDSDCALRSCYCIKGDQDFYDSGEGPIITRNGEVIACPYSGCECIEGFCFGQEE
ncbi:hypothetical protein HN935_03405 [archaeon]|nr:hypothetical protein [archaeon]